MGVLALHDPLDVQSSGAYGRDEVRSLFIIASLLTGASGCGGQERPSPSPSPAGAKAAVPTPASPSTSSSTSAPPICLDEDPTSSSQDLFSGRVIGHVDGTTWMIAHRAVGGGEWVTNAVALDAEGTGVMVHSLGQQLIEPLMASAVHGERIRVFYLPDMSSTSTEPARTLALDVAQPEAPTLTEPLAVVDFPRSGWVHRLAADEHAMIALFTAANADRTMGSSEVILVDLETGRVTKRWGTDAQLVFCHGTCGFVRSSGERVSLTTAAGGASAPSLDLDDLCSVVPLDDGNERILLALTRTGFGGWAVGSDGTVRGIDRGTWDAPVECATPVAVAGGVVFGDRLLRWDGGPKVSAPLGTQWNDALAVMGPQLIALRTDLSSGMTHSPTDARGGRRYYESWTFEGAQVRLLHVGPEAVQPQALVPVPFEPAEGTMDRGPRFAILQRGRHAAVIATHSTAHPAWFSPLLAPCP